MGGHWLEIDESQMRSGARDAPSLIALKTIQSSCYLVVPRVDSIASKATTRLPVCVSVVIVLPRIGPSSLFVLQQEPISKDSWAITTSFNDVNLPYACSDKLRI
jgi:hypothetical protein